MFVLLMLSEHCVKSVRIRKFSGPYFPAFGFSTEYLSVFNYMRKITDQKNSEYGHFSSSEDYDI